MLIGLHDQDKISFVSGSLPDFLNGLIHQDQWKTQNNTCLFNGIKSDKNYA